MVKIKGFTLIELMIVIAIVGILISMVVGPMKRVTNTATDGVSTSETTTIINGVAHSCNNFGECKAVD